MELCSVTPNGLSAVAFSSSTTKNLINKIFSHKETEPRSFSCSHSNEIKFLCRRCEVRICEECLTAKHNFCDFKLDEVYRKNLTEVTAKEFQNEFTRIKKNILNTWKNAAFNFIKVENDIMEWERKMKLKIEDMRMKLLNKLRQLALINTMLWEEGIEKCCQNLRKLEKWKDVALLSEELNEAIRAFRLDVNKLEVLNRGEVNFVAEEWGEWSQGRLLTTPSAEKTILIADDEATANTANVCMVAVKDQLEDVVLGSDYELTAFMYDDEKNSISVSVENLQNGHYKIVFHPPDVGHYTLEVLVNSEPVFGSPKMVHVSRKAVDELVTVIAEPGDEDGQVCRPWGVCCDAAGRILVADRCNHRIQIFSENGAFLGKFGTFGTDPGQFNRPAGIAVDKYSRIIIADKDNHRIQIFNSDGKYITHFGRLEPSEESLLYPWDVAVNDLCQIAVTETKLQQVRLFTDSGLLLRKFVFTPEFDLGTPRGIACAEDGSFLITDFNKHCIVRLEKDFKSGSAFGCEGESRGEFRRPQGIAIGSNGLFAVSDSRNHRVQVFRPGSPVKVIGLQGSEFGKLDTPQGIAFHPNGNVIVVDFGNNRLQVFKL